METAESTNVAVGGGEPISVGATQPSFDELAALQAPKPNGEKFAPPEAVESKSKKEDNGKQENKSKDKALEGATKDDKPVADDRPTRIIKAKAGDAELDLAHDTVIPTKVAGKLENPTLEELQADYSGRVNWDRKYKEFATERTTFQAEKQELNSLVEAMMTSAKDDPFKFFDVVGEITGQDSVALKMQAIEEQIELAQKLAKMTPQQLDQFKKDMALKFREDTLLTKETRIKNQESQKTKQAELAKVRETHQIDEDTWNETEEAAKKVYGRDVTTEEVVHTKKYLDVLDAMNSVNPEFVQAMTEDKKRFALELTAMAVNTPGFKQQDLVDIVASTFGTARGERLAKKIKDARETRGVVKTQEGKGKVLVSWDDI